MPWSGCSHASTQRALPSVDVGSTIDVAPSAGEALQTLSSMVDTAICCCQTSEPARSASVNSVAAACSSLPAGDAPGAAGVGSAMAAARRELARHLPTQRRAQGRVLPCGQCPAHSTHNVHTCSVSCGGVWLLRVHGCATCCREAGVWRLQIVRTVLTLARPAVQLVWLRGPGG